MIRPALRAAACAVAALAAIDPSLESTGTAPVAIELRTARGALVPELDQPGVSSDAVALRGRLAAALPGGVAINTVDAPGAVVVVGSGIVSSALPAQGPVFFVAPPARSASSVRVLRVRDPRPVLPGWAATVSADVSARGVAPGASAAVVLESHGMELDRIEHRWTAPDETFQARLTFAPPSAGVFPLNVRVVPKDSGIDTTGAVLPARVLAESRRLRVLAFDPRPSWASGFVRRALEDDPDFDVVTRVRASKGLEVRTGAAPASLSADAIEPFDLVVVGAPEDLSQGELSALDGFARRRGGTVALIADRRPSGSYAAWLGAGTFDEALVEKPLTLTDGDGTSLQASELTYPRELPPGADALVTIPHAGAPRAPVVAVPLGAGRVIFSGALDAWRFRGEDGEAFAAFWRSHLGREAMRAPRKLEVTLEPGTPATGREVVVRVSVRPTEFATSGSAVTVPDVSADLIDAHGRIDPVRLWPSSERGIFEGRFDAGPPGQYDVKVSGGTGVVSETPLTVSAGGGEDEGEGGGARTASLVAQATGGSVGTTADLGFLRDRLLALPRARVTERRHPMRSAWWAVVFAMLVCSEWALRRRAGLR